MKNILMVTPLYPLPTKENKCTHVCHFFTKEWIKMGYNVVVIHSQPIHCCAWHIFVKLFGKKLNNIFGGGNFYSRKITKTEHYIMDDVPVYRVPIYNFIPHGRYPEKSVKKLVNDIHEILLGLNFIPEIIVGHMTALEIIPELNKKYNAKTCMVAHGTFRKLKDRYADWEELFDSYDAWGFRSKPIKKKIIENYKEPKKTFYCYSGIPEKYLTARNKHSFNNTMSKFLYIGELIERKYPITLLEAIPQLCKDNYSIKFVGEGLERNRLESYVIEHDLSNHVKLEGRVSRDEVTDYLDEAECFIMVSRNEAYGLVYLEAMARGCIVIASRDEGFDGVIEDGVNGFLCEAGNSKELASIIHRINSMTPEERMIISNNGLSTARRMTDSIMAKEYVEFLETI